MNRRGRRLSLIGAALSLSMLTAGCAQSSSTAPQPDPDESPSAVPTPPLGLSTLPPATVSSPNPFLERPLFVWQGTKVAEAATYATPEQQPMLARLAATPTAIWLTPESLPTEAVADFVRSRIREAGPSMPVFVVYGVPNRDCSGGHSSGGLDAQSYPAWIDQIAGALAGSPTVILEPDALATAPSCGLVAEREEFLSLAIQRLAPRSTLYVDAGHSDWVDANEMAEMLKVIGIDRVRGFSVNVSAYGSDADERSYAEQIRMQIPTSHYVIDSSRNGNGANGEWCNAEGRALGTIPAGSNDGTGLDAHLWIKPPGESDGTCHGGPAAGTFWPERAIEMAQAAGW